MRAHLHACSIGFGTLHLLLLSACQQPQQPLRDRAYLGLRNVVDPAKPCLIARFGSVEVRLIKHIAFVPVQVNGMSTIGLLDTGSEATLVTPAFVAAAKIRSNPKLPVMRHYGVGGAFTATPILPDTLQVGQIGGSLPGGVFASNFLGNGSTALGVLVGGSFIDGFDWDLDFPHGKMTAYRTSNCHDIDPPWPTKSTGLPITRGTDPKIRNIASFLALPLNITIPVVFDTDTLVAVFDTGAQQSYLTLDGAHKAGITNEQLAHDPAKEIGSIDGKKVAAHVHRVPEFVVGEDLVRDFPVLVADSFDRDQKYDMILGMDWIATHHIWLSYTTDALYVDSGELKPPGWATVQVPPS